MAYPKLSEDIEQLLNDIRYAAHDALTGRDSVAHALETIELSIKEIDRAVVEA